MSGLIDILAPEPRPTPGTYVLSVNELLNEADAELYRAKVARHLPEGSIIIVLGNGGKLTRLAVGP